MRLALELVIVVGCAFAFAYWSDQEANEEAAQAEIDLVVNSDLPLEHIVTAARSVH